MVPVCKKDLIASDSGVAANVSSVSFSRSALFVSIVGRIKISSYVLVYSVFSAPKNSLIIGKRPKRGK